MSAQAQPKITPEQYLEIERAAEFRSEYYAGRMYAMSGGSMRHAVIIGRLVRALGNALDGRSCLVVANDLRLRVAPDGLYTYPDVMVACGEAKVADNRSDTLLNPTLVIEVLSPSTEGYDRGFKSAQYRTVESLLEYALVWQTQPRVEIFRRMPQGEWLLSEAIGLDAECRFGSLNCKVDLADVYNQVTFDTEPPVRPVED